MGIFPKLLLLDEIDSHLHPSLILHLVKIINESIVDKYKIAVILTTHNPTTVAISPDESIYTLDLESDTSEIKTHSLIKVSKNSALSILSVGVPTLSVSFDGRRQVFVESHTDAKLYDRLFQIYKDQFNTDKSLIFIGVGNYDQTAGKEQHGGCDHVKKIVSELVQAGNRSVFGLIDWDGENNQDQAIHVLSHQIRDGIESLLLDPVLLSSLIIREDREIAVNNGLIESEQNYLSLMEWGQDQWQSCVNKLQQHLLNTTISDCDHIDIKYLNDMTLRISKEYLHKDDHQLRDLVCTRFPSLKKHKPNKLMHEMIEKVLFENQKLLPTDLIDTFKKLIDFEIT